MNSKCNFDCFQKLYEFYQDGLNCDLKLISEDGKTFKVHGFVLAGAIPYFIEILTSSKLKIETKIVLKGIKSRELEQVVEYAYKRKINFSDHQENIVDLIKAALHLSFECLLDEGLKYVEDNINSDVVIELFSLDSRDKLAYKVRETAGRMVRRTLITDRSEASLRLTAADMKATLLDPRLHALHEESVWDCIVRWVQHDPEERTKDLPLLLQGLRIGFIQPEFLQREVLEHPLVANNEAAKKVLHDLEAQVTTWNNDYDKDQSIRLPPALSPRVPHDVILVFGGWSTEGPSSTVELYDCQAELWQSTPELKEDRCRLYGGAVFFNNTIYMVGGSRGRGSLSTCMALNLDTLSWTQCTSMNTARCYLSAVVLNHKIYAMGGRGSHERFDTVEVFDLATNMWSELASMSVKRSDAGVAILDGKIYMVGGFDGTSIVNSAEVYDPVENTWSFISPLHIPRSGVKCVAHRGYIFAIGGFNGVTRLDSGERYDPLTKTWTVIKSMITPRSNHALAVIEDRIYAIGGYIGNTITNLVEAYDVFGDAWYASEKMNSARSALSCVVVPGVEFAERFVTMDRDDPCLLPDEINALPYHREEEKKILPPGDDALQPPPLEDLPDEWLDDYLLQQHYLTDQVPQRLLDPTLLN